MWMPLRASVSSVIADELYSPRSLFTLVVFRRVNVAQDGVGLHLDAFDVRRRLQELARIGVYRQGQHCGPDGPVEQHGMPPASLIKRRDDRGLRLAPALDHSLRHLRLEPGLIAERDERRREVLRQAAEAELQRARHLARFKVRGEDERTGIFVAVTAVFTFPPPPPVPTP